MNEEQNDQFSGKVINPETQDAKKGSTRPHDVLEDNAIEFKKEPRFFKKAKFWLFMFFAILFGIAGATYAVAYEKIELKNAPELQERIAFAVQELPFMPKTPKYLIIKTVMANQNVVRQSFDASLSLEADAIKTAFNLQELKLNATGSLDYSKPKDLLLDANVTLTDGFSADVKSKDNDIYFNLNSLPQTLISGFGVEPEILAPLTGVWVRYEGFRGDGAQEPPSKEPYSLSDELVTDIREKYLDKNTLSKVKVKKESVNGAGVYKLSLNADRDLINKLGEGFGNNSRDEDKLSNVIQSLYWELYIDENNFLTRRVVLSGEWQYYDSLPDSDEGSNINFLLQTDFGDFGEEFAVDVPEEYISYEEFFEIYEGIINENIGAFIKTTENEEKDYQRLADLQAIRAALELYRSDCGEYPISIADLATSNNCASDGGKYLPEVPNDPDGIDYFYEVSAQQDSYDLCTNLDATPSAQLPQCPEEGFNFGVTNP